MHMSSRIAQVLTRFINRTRMSDSDCPPMNKPDLDSRHSDKKSGSTIQFWSKHFPDSRFSAPTIASDDKHGDCRRIDTFAISPKQDLNIPHPIELLMPINRDRHMKSRMPKNPSIEDNIIWHIELRSNANSCQSQSGYRIIWKKEV